MPHPAPLVASHLAFHHSHPAVSVFDDLSFRLEGHWRVALSGRNGVGKTTLLRLLAGELTPTAGLLQRPAEVLLHPQPMTWGRLPARQAVRDAIGPYDTLAARIERLSGPTDAGSLETLGEALAAYEALGGWGIDAAIDAAAGALGIPAARLDTPGDTLSGGERTRLAVAALLLAAEHRLAGDAWVLLDEPTRHLDMDGRAQLAAWLARHRGVLLVSHDRAFCDAVADHVLAIDRNGSASVRQGNLSTFLAERERSEAAERHRQRSLRREIRDLGVAARQRRSGAAAREASKSGAMDKGFEGARAARQMQRAISIERRLQAAAEDKAGLLQAVEKERLLRFAPGSGGRQGSLLRVDGLTLVRGERVLCRDLSLRLAAGERLLVSGPNGCGKSSLLAALCGELEPQAGSLRWAPGVRVGRVHQQPRWRDGDLDERLASLGEDAGRARQVLACLGATGPLQDRPIEHWSAGQQAKLELARCLARPADVLLWDEPLDAMDLEARLALQRLLCNTGSERPALLLVEHDRAFAAAVATGWLRLEGVVSPPA